MKPELNLVSTVCKEIESKYRGIKKQIEAIAERFVEEEVSSENERVTNNLKSENEVKQRYLETLQKYGSYEKELSSPQLQDITESTAVLGEVATAVKQMVQNVAAKPKVPVRLGSHLGQNLDEFVFIVKDFVKFLSSVDHAKCDLLVSPRTKTCPRRQIFKGAVVVPRSTTFCQQQTKIVFLVINLPVNSLNFKFFTVRHIALFVSTFVSFTITGNQESRISEQFSRFLEHSF